MYSLQAGEELILEAAGSMVSETTPFESGWAGSLGPERLLAKEFAFRGRYAPNDDVSFSLTIGYLRDFHDRRYHIVFPEDVYGYSITEGGATYSRGTVRFAEDWVKLEIGVLLYASDSRDPGYVFREDIFGRDEHPMPVVGIEFGARDYFVFASYLNAFPFISGGAYEMGFVKRISETYEHRISGSVAGYQDFALAYRGEFRIYKNIALTPGFSWGLRDVDSAYMVNLGIKAVFENSRKNDFELD